MSYFLSMYCTDIPSSHEQLKVKRVDGNSANFTWKPPPNLGNPPLTTYQLLLTLVVSGSMEETITVNVSVPDTQVLVTGLTPETTYSATITGISAMFVSPPSTPITGTVRKYDL